MRTIALDMDLALHVFSVTQWYFRALSMCVQGLQVNVLTNADQDKASATYKKDTCRFYMAGRITEVCHSAAALTGVSRPGTHVQYYPMCWNLTFCGPRQSDGRVTAMLTA